MNIYQKEAKNILKAVGENNFDNIFHCVSRLRFQIIDKKQVNLEIIKESKLIKGINWSNNQLQIILGTGIVEAIYQEAKNYLLNSRLNNPNNTKTIKNKNSKFYFLNKFMQILSDIFLPIIPAIVAAGISMGITSLIKTILKNYDYTSNSFFWTIADVINTTTFSALAVLVCYSSTKRFGGNPILGIIVGLMLISPFLPNKSDINIYQIQENFKKSFNSKDWNGKNVELVWLENTGKKFIDEIEPIWFWIIPITGYQGSVLPALFIGIIIAYLEKFSKKIIPKNVSIIFVPFLTICFSLLLSLLFLGPILLYVEKGVLLIAKSILTIKYGIGTAILAGLLQSIVISGCHQILQGLEMQLVIEGQIPDVQTLEKPLSIFNAIWTASIISQGGAAFAIALKTKDKNSRNLHFSSTFSTFFGITEPAIFGTNLPKLKPFIFGSIGGFVGGFIVGFFNVVCEGMGVTVIPGLLLYVGNIKNLLLIILVNIVSFFIAFILTFVFVKLKKSQDLENQIIKKNNIA